LAIFDDDQRRDRPQPPSALRVATGRAYSFVAPPSLWQSMAFVVASRTRPVALATNVSVFTERCTRLAMSPSLRSSIQFASLNRKKEMLDEQERDPAALTRERLLPHLLEFEMAKAGRSSRYAEIREVDPSSWTKVSQEFLLLQFDPTTAQIEDLLQLHRLTGSSGALALRAVSMVPICPNHTPVIPQMIAPALDRFFDWVRSPIFSELHPIEQMTLSQIRLCEIYPFEESCEVVVSLFSCQFLSAGGYLLPLFELHELRPFYAALEAAFAFSTSELVGLNLGAVERAYEVALSISQCWSTEPP